MTDWNHTVDFLVIGSGGGGMTAAIVAKKAGLDALVIEKSSLYGGTTAMSGGVAWVPNNHLMKEKGLKDSAEEAWQYLSKVIGPEGNETRIKAYIENAPQMIQFMEKNSRLKFNAAVEYADYYAEFEGGKVGGRSLDPAPFSFRELGAEGEKIRPPNGERILGKITLTAIEAHDVMQSKFHQMRIIAWRLLCYYADIKGRLAKQRDDRLTLGECIVGRLRASLLDFDIPLWLNTEAKQLIVEQDKLVGVLVAKDGKQIKIKAKKGVLMATGGFAHNTEMREQYQQSPIGNQWTNANPGDLGEGIKMGQAIGADVEFMQCAWWTPTMILPDGLPEAQIVGKSLPGCIYVNKKGQRFCNEAAPYEDVVKGQYQANSEESPSIPAVMIFDARYRRHYTVGNGRILPGEVMPDEKVPEAYFSSGFLKKADSIRHLADLCDISADGLVAGVTRFNRFARSGKDEDFGRGETIQDRYYSDPKIKPNPCLAPIEEPPFYAINIWPGDLGTKGGLKCDEFGRVLNTTGDVIDGFYATGNCSGAVMGNSYPGAGATIGPALTFGYIAARHAAGEIK